MSHDLPLVVSKWDHALLKTEKFSNIYIYIYSNEIHNVTALIVY